MDSDNKENEQENELTGGILTQILFDECGNIIEKLPEDDSGEEADALSDNEEDKVDNRCKRKLTQILISDDKDDTDEVPVDNDDGKLTEDCTDDGKLTQY